MAGRASVLLAARPRRRRRSLARGSTGWRRRGFGRQGRQASWQVHGDVCQVCALRVARLHHGLHLRAVGVTALGRGLAWRAERLRPSRTLGMACFSCAM